jgi:hypothetical protein
MLIDTGLLRSEANQSHRAQRMRCVVLSTRILQP